MEPNILAWAPYLIGGVIILTVSPARRLVGLLLVAAFAVVGLLLASEPDLRD